MRMTRARKQALIKMVALVLSTCAAVFLGNDNF